MKLLTVWLNPISLKGDPEDEDTLRVDLYEKIQTMLDDETLGFTIDDEDSEEEFE